MADLFCKHCHELSAVDRNELRDGVAVSECCYAELIDDTGVTFTIDDWDAVHTENAQEALRDMRVDAECQELNFD